MTYHHQHQRSLHPGSEALCPRSLPGPGGIQDTNLLPGRAPRRGAGDCHGRGAGGGQGPGRGYGDYAGVRGKRQCTASLSLGEISDYSHCRGDGICPRPPQTGAVYHRTCVVCIYYADESVADADLKGEPDFRRIKKRKNTWKGAGKGRNTGDRR